jgi:hypothetical protein
MQIAVWQFRLRCLVTQPEPSSDELESTSSGLKVTLRLSSRALQELDWVAAHRGVTRGQALDFAVADETFLLKAARENRRLFVEEEPSPRLRTGKRPRSLLEIDPLAPR